MDHNDIAFQTWYAWQGVALEFATGQLVQVTGTAPLTVRAGRDDNAPRVTCTADDLAPANQSALLARVWEHAKAQYDQGGWDIFVECWTDNDLAEVIAGAEDGATAIEKASRLAAALEDRRGDIAGTADEPHQPWGGWHFVGATDATDPLATSEPEPDTASGRTVAMLVLYPSGDTRDVHVPYSTGDDRDRACLGAFYQHMECDTVDVVRLDGVDMWVDDEGLLTGQALNVPATYVAGRLVEEGQTIQPGFMGTVVFTGTDQGSVVSLPAATRQRITEALGELRARQQTNQVQQG